MASLPRLRLQYSSLEALRADFESNLSKARAFVAGATGVSERELCELVLVHPDADTTLSVRADVVWVSPPPSGGVGVQLVDFGPELLHKLGAFVETCTPQAQVRDAGRTDSNASAGASEAPPDRRRAPRNVHERIRQLSIRERETMARQGTVTERVALERCFGSAVWEGLLQNPNLTAPEVTRIAKNGTLPRPLVGLIVANPAWLSKPEVQRALLTNPRVTGPHLERVLRAMPHSELTRVAQRSAYRAQVRSAAQRLLGK